VNERIKNGLLYLGIQLINVLGIILVGIVAYFIDVELGGNGQAIIFLFTAFSIGFLIIGIILFFLGLFEKPCNHR